MDYDFDINGSLRRKENVDESEFYLFNTFGCMKAYSFDGERFGYYGYDASGERTYKIDFDATFSKENGVIAVQSLDIEKMMLYPNGYMNINQSGEYTKHYYADALRIASKIGSGFTGNLCDSATATDYSGYLNARITFQSDIMVDELNEVVVPLQDIQQINPMPYPTFCNLDSGGQEPNLFFYHPDHLGSTGVVTDNNANVTQGFIYSPFGELIYEHNPAWENNRVPKYAFNAKELDEENGMYYYSARYYAPPTFISRDPMFEKYPSINPYSYCANNPMKFVDPTGKKIDPANETEWNNEKQAITDKKTWIDGEINRLTAKAEQKGWSENKLNRKTGDLKERSASLGKTLNTMSDLENSSTTYTLKAVGGDGYFGQGKGNDAGKMVIAYSSTSSFVHEVTHGGQYHNGEVGFLPNGTRSGYDLTDEVNAYRAALAYDRYSYDNTYYRPSQITTDWVRERGSENHFPYKNLPSGPINAPMYKSSRKRNNAF